MSSLWLMSSRPGRTQQHLLCVAADTNQSSSWGWSHCDAFPVPVWSLDIRLVGLAVTSLKTPPTPVSSLTAAPERRSASLRLTAVQRTVNEPEPVPPPLSVGPSSPTLPAVPEIEFSQPLPDDQSFPPAAALEPSERSFSSW